MAKSRPTAQYRMPARSLFLSSRGRQTGSSAILAGACAVQYHHMTYNPNHLKVMQFIFKHKIVLNLTPLPSTLLLSTFIYLYRKKTSLFIMLCKDDSGYITQLKQQKSKR